MKKDLGIVQAVYPHACVDGSNYDENEKVNVMNVAWGQICDGDKIILLSVKGRKHGSILRQAEPLLLRLPTKRTWTSPISLNRIRQ